MLAGKCYGADCIEEAITGMGAEVAVPPKPNRAAPRACGGCLHKERSLAERMFNKMKHFRGIATRRCKLAVSCAAFLQLAAIALWLK